VAVVVKTVMIQDRVQWWLLWN